MDLQLTRKILIIFFFFYNSLQNHMEAFEHLHQRTFGFLPTLPPVNVEQLRFTMDEEETNSTVQVTTNVSPLSSSTKPQSFHYQCSFSYHRCPPRKIVPSTLTILLHCSHPFLPHRNRCFTDRFYFVVRIADC